LAVGITPTATVEKATDNLELYMEITTVNFSRFTNACQKWGKKNIISSFNLSHCVLEISIIEQLHNLAGEFVIKFEKYFNQLYGLEVFFTVFLK